MVLSTSTPSVRSLGRATVAPQRGLFVAIEGVTCSGKSTLSKGLMEYLAKLTQRPTFRYADPYSVQDTAVRKYLDDAREQLGTCDAMDVAHLYPFELGVLYCLNRVRLWDRIEWELSDGHNVVCDRWVHSTLAYNCDSDEERTRLQTFHQVVLELPNPDLTLVLDVSYEEYRKRLAVRSQQGGQRPCDVFEEARFNEIRDVYWRHQSSQPYRVLSTDHRSPGEVLNEAIRVLHEELGHLVPPDRRPMLSSWN